MSRGRRRRDDFRVFFLKALCFIPIKIHFKFRPGLAPWPWLKTSHVNIM